MDAIREHFPELEEKYKTYFLNGYEMPLYYRQAFAKKMKELSEAYSMPSRIGNSNPIQ